MKTFRMDCSPTYLRDAVDRCNAILNGKKKIDIFGVARVDKNVPIEETVKALGEMVDEGKIGGIQLSEVAADTIRRANKVYKIDMIEAEVSLWSTDIFDNGVAEVCKELSVVVCGHTPLGAGMLTGQINSIDDMPANDHHRYFPRFQPENFSKNLELVKEVEKLAKAKGCTTAQLALSWVKAKEVVPVAGARSVERVRENCNTVELMEMDLEDIDRILKSFPIQGMRYPGLAMQLVEY
jgi:pyridoxine 4-dehydrogenase